MMTSLQVDNDSRRSKSNLLPSLETNRKTWKLLNGVWQQITLQINEKHSAYLVHHNEFTKSRSCFNLNFKIWADHKDRKTEVKQQESQMSCDFHDSSSFRKKSALAGEIMDFRLKFLRSC